MHQIRRYNIVVKGRVQDIGFRDFVIALANIAKIRGYIFNDIDGSVRIVMEGAKEIVNNFLNEIKSRDILGVEIKSLIQKEIAGDFDLPARFVKLSTDEMYDIDRKLGIGNEYLNEIKHDTSVLPDVKNGIDTLNGKFDTLNEKFDTLNEKFDSFTTKFDSYISEQRVFNMRMDEHNHRLEKILEKLTEK